MNIWKARWMKKRSNVIVNCHRLFICEDRGRTLLRSVDTNAHETLLYDQLRYKDDQLRYKDVSVYRCYLYLKNRPSNQSWDAPLLVKFLRWQCGRSHFRCHWLGRGRFISFRCTISTMTSLGSFSPTSDRSSLLLTVRGTSSKCSLATMK